MFQLLRALITPAAAAADPPRVSTTAAAVLRVFVQESPLQQWLHADSESS